MPDSTQVVVDCEPSHFQVYPDGEGSDFPVFCKEGNWTAIVVQCMRRCDYIRNLDKKHYVVTHDARKNAVDLYPHGSSATVKCRGSALDTSSYPFRTNETLLCYNGQWTAQTLECKSGNRAAFLPFRPSPFDRLPVLSSHSATRTRFDSGLQDCMP